MLAEGSLARRAGAPPAGGPAAARATFLTVRTVAGIAAGITLCLSPAAAPAGEALAKAKQCEACHAPAAKRIGPSWDAIAARYRGRPEAAPVLAVKIRRGGAGSWGAVPMPANTQVDEADAARLVAWILARSPKAAAKP